MAFTRRATLVGCAALTAVSVGSVTTAAAADQTAPSPSDTVFARLAALGDGLAHEVADQAQAQQQAAEAARARAAAWARARKERAERAAERRRAARAAARRTLLITWVKPINSGISTAYRAGGGLWSSGYHTGVDFTAAIGTAVRSVGSGTVVEAGWDGSYGNDVIVRMSDGMYVLYGHLSSVGVQVGQSLVPGQLIGQSGATGNVTGPHLHFEVRTTPDYGADVDPVAYLRRHGVSV
jgi:murein DD-endopeptidase MepM/ murein hydrolase activator NlpD